MAAAALRSTVGLAALRRAATLQASCRLPATAGASSSNGLITLRRQTMSTAPIGRSVARWKRRCMDAAFTAVAGGVSLVGMFAYVWFTSPEGDWERTSR